ncbi:MAG: phosphatase PAP2 family protein [Saprospiraceae bacterium]|nr:phosphatase PAP2 family protein [Saprospiraceae bacterium]
MLHLDQELFYFINNALHVSTLDKIAPYWRSMYLWLPLYVFFISYLFFNFEKKQVAIYLLALGLTVGTADILSSRVIKKTVARLRPCNDETVKLRVKLLVPCGGGYSFTSSHATNHFAVAVFVILTFVGSRKWLKYSLLAWAISIAFGQVYVGVHYPLDVVCGAMLGSGVGWFGAFVYKQKFGHRVQLFLCELGL